MDKGTLNNAWSDFRFQAPTALVFQLVVQLGAFAVLGPLFTWAGRTLVLASGEAVISNYDLTAFARSPAGAVFVLSFALISILLFLAQLAGQTWIAGHAIARNPVTVRAAVVAVARRLPALLAVSARVLLRLALFALPFLAGLALVAHTLLGAHDINYYLEAHPPEWRNALLWAALIAGAYLLLAAWQLARWLYTVPILMFESTAAGAALAASTHRTHGRLAVLVSALLAWAALVLAAGAAVAFAAHHLELAALSWADVAFARVLPLVALFLLLRLGGAFLQNAILIAGQQLLVTRDYVEERGVARWQAPPPEGELYIVHRRGAAMLAAGAVLLALGVGAAWVIAAQPYVETGVAITAHRGDSRNAPENTLAAFRAAMAAHADFAELDVQRTRDGEVVVLHDGDLMRMAGDPRRIRALTGAELAMIDVGSKFGAAFRGERVPSLAAVIGLVRGHMRLNVELKYNGPDPELAAATVKVLREENFIDQVVITSLSATALRQVQALEPRLRTGQIVTAAVGNLARTEADFLSLNAARATGKVIRRAHAAGKAVHVWTLNRAEAMLRMIERGADNLITDDPRLAVGIRAQLRELTSRERLALRLRALFGEPPRELTDPEAVTVL